MLVFSRTSVKDTHRNYLGEGTHVLCLAEVLDLIKCNRVILGRVCTDTKLAETKLRQQQSPISSSHGSKLL